MGESYWWYVLYVKTNTEHKVVNYFQKVFDQEKENDDYRLEAFCPESEHYYKKRFRKLGSQYIKRPLFPGYVFIETNMPSSIFRSRFLNVISRSQDIIRLLKYGDSEEIALSEKEKERFEFLLKGKRCIDHSIGYIEGDKIIIQGGGLVGLEGDIKKINRHHRSAQIEIDLFNQKLLLEVALEIIAKK